MRNLLRLITVFSFVLFSQAALSFDKKPYSDALFDELAQTDDVVLVDVFAPWCPTCKKQQKAIGAYLEKNPDKPVHVLVVDFDNDKKTVKKLRAPRQSTLLIFKNGEQFWYSVAETRPKVIAAELNKALKFKSKKKS
jgi:thiol-disulfide isomerase/thioredoxin